MKFSLEVSHPNLTAYKYFINDSLVSEGECDKSIELAVDASADTISVWFEPWTIHPYVRVNNILVNYALADIHMFDHKFDVVINKNFFDEYRNRDVNYRVRTLFSDGKVNKTVYDNIIGADVPHTELVNQIKSYLDE